MNKTLKVLPIILGALILALGISIPVLAMGSKKDKNNTKIVASVSEQVVTDSSADIGSADILKAEAAETVDEDKADSATGSKALAAAIVVGIAAAAGAIGMGMAISKSAEGISRQPEAAGNIRTSLMLGLVFIETAIIYALIVAILIIFVM